MSSENKNSKMTVLRVRNDIYAKLKAIAQFRNTNMQELLEDLLSEIPQEELDEISLYNSFN